MTPRGQHAVLATMLLTRVALADVRVVAGGDVIPHQSVKQSAQRFAAGSSEIDGWTAILGDVVPLLQAGDVSVLNLETPLVDVPARYQGPFIFSAPPALAFALRAAGVDVVTFGNNHARDQHLAGIEATRNIASRAGLGIVGAAETRAQAWELLRLRSNGAWVCALAFARRLNGFTNREHPETAHVPYVPYRNEWRPGCTGEQTLVEVVAAAAQTCDAVLVFPHWGEEYAFQPRSEDVDLAARLRRAGATAILGTHSHVIGPIVVERLEGRTTLVAYSLGNFLSAQGTRTLSDPTRFGLLLDFRLVHGEHGMDVAGVRAHLLYTAWRRLGDGQRAVVVQSCGENPSRLSVEERACERAMESIVTPLHLAHPTLPREPGQ